MERPVEIILEHVRGQPLYEVVSLQKALFQLGYSIPRNILYDAMKTTGWIKLFLIRERLLMLKKSIPKEFPFTGIRQLVKWPLLVDRAEDLPIWKEEK